MLAMLKHIIVILALLAVVGGTIWLMSHQALLPDANQGADSATTTKPVILPISEESPAIPADVVATIAQMSDRIVLTEPQPMTTVSNPIEVTGEARGMWFFEGSFPITVVNWNGLIIGEGFATAQGEWMVEEFVPFTANIAFTRESDSYNDRGTLILRRDNPTGLPEHDAALEIPIILP